MFDVFSLIGYSKSEAQRILEQNGLSCVKVVQNSKPDSRCNQSLVCAVKLDGEKVTLICGEFLLDDYGEKK